MRVVGRNEISDTTLLIHGSLLEDTYRFYCHFYGEVPKIFSTLPDNHKLNNWRRDVNSHGPESLLLEACLPDGPRISREAKEMVFCSLEGIKHIKTKYVILLRGDEWYSNLDQFRKGMSSDNKIYMSPLFVKKWKVWPFHMGTHVVGTTVENLRRMLEAYLLNTEANKIIWDSCWPLPFPSVLAKGYLDDLLGRDSSKEDFKEKFEVLPLESLKFYKACLGPATWYSNLSLSVLTMEDL